VTIRYIVFKESATLLRSARRGARLTQIQLADRAGVTQSVISAYESGRRQPSLPTLQALIAATGYELEFQLRTTPRRLDPLTGPIGKRVRQNRRRLLDRAAAHGIRNLTVFGSVARGEDRPDSDLDLAGDLPAGMGLVGLGRARDEFEAIIGCAVDLVPFEDLKADIREHVEAEMVGL
jgi:predicted nucleotidyltransferase/DNA-binding XRE family transcriptional regulator